MLSKDIFVPLTICIDQTCRALVIVLPCYGALEVVGVIIIIIIIISESWDVNTHTHHAMSVVLQCKLVSG